MKLYLISEDDLDNAQQVLLQAMCYLDAETRLDCARDLTEFRPCALSVQIRTVYARLEALLKNGGMYLLPPPGEDESRQSDA